MHSYRSLFPPNHKSSKVIIGEDALKKLAIDPFNVIYDVKRIVGRKCNDPEIKSFKYRHEFNVTCNDRDDNPSIFVPNLGINGEYIAPEQVLAVILAHLVEIASKEFGVPYIRDVVVSIPALFHNGQRKAIHSACSLAGLNVAQLTVEPTAAALAYSYYSSTPLIILNYSSPLILVEVPLIAQCYVVLVLIVRYWVLKEIAV